MAIPVQTTEIERSGVSRMLWAAITGLLGVEHHLEGCTVHPHLPDRWKWAVVREMSHGDGEETIFLSRQNGKLHMVHGPLHGLTTDLPHTGQLISH